MRIVTIFIAGCLSFLSPAHGQVAAGVPDNLVPGQDFISLNAFTFSFGDFVDLYDSLDLNLDGQFDVLFNANAARVADYLGGGTGAWALHTRFEMMADSSGDATSLALGDSINASQNWIGSSANSLLWCGFVARFWGFTGQLQEYGDWVSVPEAYAGFRIITTQPDTLYGWMYVKAAANANAATASLKITSWAIQNTPSSTDVKEPLADKVMVQPNPAHEYATFEVVGQNLENVRIRLFDPQGNLLHEADFSAAKGRLDLNGLPAGIYFWELSGAGWNKSGKIVKPF